MDEGSLEDREQIHNRSKRSLHVALKDELMGKTIRLSKVN